MPAKITSSSDPRVQQHVGKKFGKLTAVKFARMGSGSSRGQVWEFRCECGSTTTRPISAVILGNTRSCGCLWDEVFTKHGCCGTKIYRAWNHMLDRCSNPKNLSYKNYGGRGIKVCKKWKLFKNFLNDMGLPPEGMELERMDNNGDYKPSNCKWDTEKNQSLNKRNSRMIEFNGETLNLCVWAKRIGITSYSLSKRIESWGIEAALKTPKLK